MGCSSSVAANANAPSNSTGNTRSQNGPNPSSKGVIIVQGMLQSPATQRVLAAVIEKGLKYEFQVINVGKGENSTPEYLKKQPFGVIPVLIDVDGTVVYESRAICRYLEIKYKGKGTELIPAKSAKAEGLFEQAASIESSYFDGLANQIVMEKVMKKMRGGEPDMVKVANARTQLSENLDVYDYILKRQQYLAGDTFTLADLFHLPLGSVLMQCGESALFDSRPNVKRWWDKISSRPAWKTVQSLK